MEKKEIIVAVEEAAKSAGISEKKLNADISATYLPETGKFVGWKVANPGETTAHIRMLSDDGSSISVGTLKALAFTGKVKDAKFKKIENPSSPINGGYVLTGTTAVNPNISGKMAEVVANLMDRNFVAEPVELVTLSVKSENNKVVPFTTEDEAKSHLITRKFYRVKLV